MRDEDAQVREKVAIALGVSGDSRAWAALSAAANDPDPQVREKVTAALIMLKAGMPTPAVQHDLAAAVRLALRAIERVTR
jgi:HEAT repeat protein